MVCFLWLSTEIHLGLRYTSTICICIYHYRVNVNMSAWLGFFLDWIVSYGSMATCTVAWISCLFVCLFALHLARHTFLWAKCQYCSCILFLPLERHNCSQPGFSWPYICLMYAWMELAWRLDLSFFSWIEDSLRFSLVPCHAIPHVWAWIVSCMALSSSGPGVGCGLIVAISWNVITQSKQPTTGHVSPGLCRATNWSYACTRTGARWLTHIKADPKFKILKEYCGTCMKN